LALLAAAGLRAQTLSVSPPNPAPGDKVTVTVSNIFDCLRQVRVEVTPPGAGRNGLIRVPIELACACVTPPPAAQSVETGPLAFGTYDVKLYKEFRDRGELCAPPDLVHEEALTVSRNGEVVALRPEPAHPKAGQPVTVGFDTFCPVVTKGVRIEPGTEPLIVIDEDPEAPQPAGPCSTVPSWPVRHSVGPLAAGIYRLRVRMGPSTPQLETVAESVFTVGSTVPALELRNGRFRVSADWSAPGFGQGTAQGVPLTAESGYLTFFSASNLELVVKVLDGCSVNQRYWVFLAGLTDVGVTVRVEDTFTGRTETYSNPFGRAFQPVRDTQSFATCP
jgi:hypothetical protein